MRRNTYKLKECYKIFMILNVKNTATTKRIDCVLYLLNHAQKSSSEIYSPFFISSSTFSLAVTFVKLGSHAITSFFPSVFTIEISSSGRKSNYNSNRTQTQPFLSIASIQLYRMLYHS